VKYWVVTVDGEVSHPFTVQAEAWKERTRWIKEKRKHERDVTVVKARDEAEALMHKPSSRF
jgi:hypothetical protein